MEPLGEIATRRESNDYCNTKVLSVDHFVESYLAILYDLCTLCVYVRPS